MEENNIQNVEKKKNNISLYIILIGVVVLIGIGIGYFFYKTNNKQLPINNDETEKREQSNSSSNKVMYYSIEENGEFTPSSLAKKVSDYKTLNKKFFIKETISEAISANPVIEVFYGTYESDKDTIEYFTYGFYSKEDFNNFFSSYINKGLKCDGSSNIYIGEGSYYKCVEHETGYKYDRIDSEACIITNSNTICVKPNDWNNVSDYKTKFEKVGWTCAKTDQENQNYVLCQKEESNFDDLYIYIHDDGRVVVGSGSYCYVNHDLASWCFNTHNQ